MQKFDDLTALPAAAAPVGTYKGLLYQGFNLASQGAAGVQVAGVSAHSPPNIAASDNLSRATSGSPTALKVTGKTVTFSLYDFYFGCVLAYVFHSLVLMNEMLTLSFSEENSLTATPTSCSVTLTGYRGSKAVVQQTVKFTANGQLLQPMVLAKLKGFNLLTQVTLVTSNPTTTALLTDDYYYTYFTK